MATFSTKLGLTLPSLEDEIHQTIQDLANNFLKIDDDSSTYVSSIPTSGYYHVHEKVWKTNPLVGDYIGYVNIREGQAAPVWGAVHNYSVGDHIIPSIDNGHYYECIQAGTSGTVEPTFPTIAGTILADTRNGTTWQASKAYHLNDIVLPSVSNNRFYICTVAGTSGTVEPVWNTLDGGTVLDSGVVWTSYRILKWQEKGTACLFRPFGKID